MSPKIEVSKVSTLYHVTSKLNVKKTTFTPKIERFTNFSKQKERTLDKEVWET